MQKLSGNIAQLSVQKFSSNVIEKCLERADDETKALFVSELCDCKTIHHLLNDQYANYVVQRALTVASLDQGTLLVNAIKPHLEAIRNTSCGRRLVNKIQKRYPTIDLELSLVDAA